MKRFVLLSLILLGCAGSPPRSAVDARGEDSPALAPLATPLPLHLGVDRYVVLGKRSRLTLAGRDSVLGHHEMELTRWWGHIDLATATIDAELDLRSLRTDEAMVSSLVKGPMLEVDRYPTATLSATLFATSEPGRVILDGTLRVHGTEGAVRFTGTIREEGEGYRLVASFPMSRRAFGVHYAPVEPFLDDLVRVNVDALATAERVEVEEQN